MSTNPILSNEPTTQQEERGSRNFVQDTLPWVIAATAFVLYLLTLNRWLSLGNLPHVAKVSGWTWNAELVSPLFMIATYPFRWLPEHLVPISLNIFAAACAAGVLGLLARSVALLPHDRTIAQRERERGEFGLLTIRAAWAPVLIAVLVCGLQISFWENAIATRTSAGYSPSGHMFDLLWFAYAVRCLLEYRISEKDSWMYQAALMFGLTIPNDWAMLGYLPLLVAAMVWIKGVSFFNARFLSRVFLFGIAGLPLYLVLPFVYAFFSSPEINFWYSFRQNIGSQLYMLKVFWAQKNLLVVLSFTSLLPVLFIGIRWSSYFGDTSRTGAALAKFIFHIGHAFFLLACIWIALDPPVSPRNMGMPVPFLSFYYLSALAVGYFTGYFLLVFSTRKSSRFARYVPRHVRVTNGIVQGAIWALLVLVPITLLTLNLPRIRQANGTVLRQYAEAVVDQLPKGGGILLSDDSKRTMLVRAALNAKGRNNEFVLIDTGWLPMSAYHAYMNRQHPQLWPSYLALDTGGPIPQIQIAQLIYAFAQTNRMFYLHPSFGYFFEMFHAEPRGLVYELKPYATNVVMAPPLSPEALSHNLGFWRALLDDRLEQLEVQVAPPAISANPTLGASLMHKAHLKMAPHPDALLAAHFYSHGLNQWGCELQRHIDFTNSAVAFDHAQKLNSENVVARVNLAYNRGYVKGQRQPITLSEDVEKLFGRYRTWEQVLRNNGPYEEPGLCYSQGEAFQSGHNYRQAAQQFGRALDLFPGHAPAALALANLYVVNRMPDEALPLLGRIHSLEAFANQPTNLPSLAMVESAAHLLKKDERRATESVQTALNKAQDQPAVSTLILEAAVNTFVRYNSLTSAVPLVEQWLSLAPDNGSALAYQGYLAVQLGRYDEAVPALTRALTVQTNDVEWTRTIRYNRALAQLRTGDYQAARQDYETLLKQNVTTAPVHYGIAEAALNQNDTNTAIRHLQAYLDAAPADSEEAQEVQQKLRELRGQTE